MTMPTPGSKRIVSQERLSSEELRDFLDTNGFSNKEFAEVLGVTEQAVKLWKTGKRDFSVTNSRLIQMFIRHPQLLKEF